MRHEGDRRGNDGGAESQVDSPTELAVGASQLGAYPKEWEGSQPSPWVWEEPAALEGLAEETAREW